MKAVRWFSLALAIAPVALSTPSYAASDAPFLTEAMKGDNNEVALGALAVKRGTKLSTRSFGKMLVHDHGAHRMKLAALGRTMGVEAATALSHEGAEAQTMMMALHGASFDAAFKQHMVADHETDIAKYEIQARSAHSPAVRNLAKQTLSTLQKHLATAKAL